MIYLTDTVSRQVYCFLMSVGVGAVLGCVYDVFKLLHIFLPSKKVVVFVEDVLYWIIAVFVTFIFILTFNSGEIRGFLLIGELCGFIIYYFLMSPFVVKLLKFIVSAFVKVFKFIFKIISAPIKFIFRIIRKLLRPVCTALKKLLKKLPFLQKKSCGAA